jgi:hypothetical protein
MESTLKVIQPLATGTGHQYMLHEKIQKSITKLFQKNEDTDGHWIKGQYIRMHDMERHCKLKPCL